MERQPTMETHPTINGIYYVNQGENGTEIVRADLGSLGNYSETITEVYQNHMLRKLIRGEVLKVIPIKIDESCCENGNCVCINSEGITPMRVEADHFKTNQVLRKTLKNIRE